MNVTIVDFGLGNLRSLERKLSLSGLSVAVSSDPEAVEAARHIILPGVGNFGPAMERLISTGLATAIKEAVLLRGIPVLGICLGMQLLTEWSAESRSSGLGLLPGRAQQLRSLVGSTLPVPHLGWSRVDWRHPRMWPHHELMPLDCYFAHSYHVVCDDELVLASAVYGLPFVAAIAAGPVVGVQFHPEKSSRSGIAALCNLLELQASR